MAVNLVIATNMAALNANRNLSAVGRKRGRINKKISSGNRLYSASEDAASLSISSKMKAQIRSFESSKKNTEDTINMLKVGEGALTEINSIFQRCRELSIQASTDTLTTSDRQKISKEMTEALNAADEILKNTEFNERKIFVEGFGDIFQTGAGSGDVLLIDSSVFLTKLDSMMESKNRELYENVSELFNKTIKETMQTLLSKDPWKIGDDCTMFGQPSRLFDYQNLLNPIFDAIDSLDTFGSESVAELKQNLKNDIQKLIDDTRKSSYDELVKRIGSNSLNTPMNVRPSTTDTIGTVFKPEDSITQNPPAGTVRVTIGMLLDKVKDPNRLVLLDNQFDSFPSSFQNIFDKYEKEFLNEDNYLVNSRTMLKQFSNGEIEISAEKFSQIYIPQFDRLISNITDKQVAMGSGINRLEHTLNTTQVTKENLYASNSKIEDVDMANEMMNYTLDAARVEYATLLLSQSNSNKNDVLRLLE